MHILSLFIPARLRSRSAFFLLFLLLLPAAGAQTLNQAEVNILGMYPRGQFRAQVDRSFGISGGYTRVFLPKSTVSLHFGGDIGYVTYGKDTTSVSYSAEYPDYLIGVQIKNNILQFGLKGKISFALKPIRPYIEGRTGYSYFFTKLSIDNSQGSQTIDPSGTGYRSNTTTYQALGAGLLIPVYTDRGNEDSRGFAISIDLRFLHWWGNRVDYLIPGSVKIDSDSYAITYTTINTRTDMSSFHIGATLDF